jgi:multidrug resistance efflux pump
MKKLIISIVVLALIAGCSPSSATSTPTPTAAAKKSSASGGASAQGYVTPMQHADLSFRTGGRVAQVLVKEGDQVKASQPLVKLQDAELKAALAQAQADLARLQAGARPEEIAAAQANVDVANGQVKAATVELDQVKSGAAQAADLASAQAQLAQAQAQLKSVRDSYDSITTGIEIAKKYGRFGSTLAAYEAQTRVQLTAAQAAYDAAQKRVTQARASGSDDLRAAQARLGVATGQRDAAQAQLNLLKAGTTPEQIDAAKARVMQAQAALDEATLVAPFDGTIAELTVNVGEIVGPGPRIASTADLTQLQVETDDLSEVDIVNVQPGAEASITVDALPGVTLKGQVKSIVPRSAVKRGDVTYTVKVAITDPDARLKWGMTAFVDIRGK